MGAAAIEALEKITKGEEVDAVIVVPIEIVTKDNVEPYRSLFK